MEESVEPGSCTPTAGWASRWRKRDIDRPVGPPQAGLGIIAEGAPSDLLLKRWLLGNQLSHEPLLPDSASTGALTQRKLFYRLVQQAVAVDPTPYRSIVADWDAEAP